MTPKQIKTLKTKIETHKQILYSIENLEVDLIYDALKTLIRMGAGESIIEIWFKDIEKEVEDIEVAIERIEKEVYESKRASRT